MRPFISITTDFGIQTQGIGNIKGVIFSINPETYVIDLMHGLPDFDITTGARTMEAVYFLPIGYHVCVVDPGVGIKRKAIIIQVGRGDYFIGPDNGVLIPATRFLKGIKKVVEINNPKYMRQPVSSIFHGRDVFAPAAAWLSKGIKIEEFGPTLEKEDLQSAPYQEAEIKGDRIEAQVISINKFGSFHLNITHETWDKFGVKKGQSVELRSRSHKISLPVVETFGEVKKGTPLIMKDDYLRIEVAINQGSFVKQYPLKIGEVIVIEK